MNFRRVITALAVLALFTGLASAQLPTNQNLTCTVSAATSPSIRLEGKAELVGDVLLTCAGGPTQTATAADLGTVNVVVDYGVAVASRFAGSAVSGNQPTDALLFIDEPGTTNSPFAAIKVCAFGATCTHTTTGVALSVKLDPADENAYQGYIPKDKPNQLEFDNVPVVTLGGTNFQHIFRISNARVAPGSSGVTAAVTVTPTATSNIGLLLSGGSSAVVATPAQGLVTAVSAPGISLCGPADIAGSKGSPNLAILAFKEGFNGAFKYLTVTNPATNQSSVTGSYKKANNQTGSDTTTLQSESGVVTGTFGLADSATRLKAVFTGLDKNVTYYVSLNNVADYPR